MRLGKPVIASRRGGLAEIVEDGVSGAVFPAGDVPALEEALYAQNEKLKQERTDALKESMRNTGYRRVLMSQLLNDNRIKEYVAEILNDEKHLPAPTNTTAHAPALPAASSSSSSSDGGGSGH